MERRSFHLMEPSSTASLIGPSLWRGERIEFDVGLLLRKLAKVSCVDWIEAVSD